VRKKMAIKLSNAFLVVRDCYYAKLNNEYYPEEKLNASERYINDLRAYINSQSSDIERTFLLFCIDTLKKVKDEGDDAKISRFCHAVFKIPYIFCGEEIWDKSFKKYCIETFCDRYGYEYFNEILALDVPKIKKEAVNPRKIYRFNEMNIVKLPTYFLLRMLLPIIVLPFVIFCMLYVHYSDYTEEDHGRQYIINDYTFEYEHSDGYDYLHILPEGYNHHFSMRRFFQYSNNPEKLVELCQRGERLIVYAEYVEPTKFEDYYNIIQIEDENGNIYRSYEQSNQLDKYMLIMLGIIGLVIFIPSMVVLVLMLIVASNPRKFVHRPRFVKFCFPNYSLTLKKE